MIYRRVLRPILFTQDSEIAHERMIRLLALASRLPLVSHRPAYRHPRLCVALAGLDFPNPVGLAAGCDKNGAAVSIWPAFGYGHVEIGTITAQPQPGNPKPRVFRLREYDAVINRLGFNSEGSEAVAKRIARLRQSNRLPIPLGINIGKTRSVIAEDAVLEDYCTSFRRLAPLADYITVNVSSPNTPGLRQWQSPEKLSALLSTLQAAAKSAPASLQEGAPTHTAPTPIFVKLSPDMAEEDMRDVVQVAVDCGLAGIIATNTTLAREGVTAERYGEGGLSGRPLRARANYVLATLYREAQGRLPLIGVGGIFSAEDAYARIQAGASLIQLYTGMIYEGPYLPMQIHRGLLRLMDQDGVKQIAEVVGAQAAEKQPR